MSTNELSAKLRDYKSLKEMLAEVQDALSAIEDEIKAHMGETEELKAMGVTVKWTRYSRCSFDSKTFKAEHPAMHELYTKETQSRRFSVA